MMPPDNSSAHLRERSFGLDVVRSLAIGAVLLCHCLLILVPALFPLSPVGVTTGVVLGYYGVELFFVLSGYLIGGILLDQVLPNPGIRSVGRFFLRRWLRILPAYYLVLVVLILLEAVPGRPLQVRWDYVFFLQNYTHGAELFFPVSWSLAIEQWSYLLAPIVLLGVPRLFVRVVSTPQGRILMSLITVFALFAVARLVTGWLTDATWDMGIRKQIHLRLDTVFFGVLIVCCERYWPRFHQQCASLPAFAAVCTGLGLLVYTQADVMVTGNTPGGPDYSLFFKTLGFTLTDLLLALTLPFFRKNRFFQGSTVNNPPFFICFTAGSRYAYSLYLVHFPIFIAIAAQMAVVAGSSLAIRVLSLGLGALLALVFSWITARVLYRFCEKPGMEARRFIDNNRIRRGADLSTEQPPAASNPRNSDT